VATTAPAARASEIGGVIVEGLVDGMLGQKLAPIFLQWLATVANIVHQIPDAFEFSESLLRQLAVHHSSGQFENFIGDSQKEKEALRKAAFGEGVGQHYKSCFWRKMREEHWSQVRNDSYNSDAYPRELTEEDIDTSSRRLTPWVLQSDGSKAAEERSRRERLARELQDEKNRVVRAQRQEMQEMQGSVQQLQAELAAERQQYELALAAERQRNEQELARERRVLAEERLRREENDRRLETVQREKELLHRQYTEDVGHAPVAMWEATQVQSVEAFEDSLVLVSHMTAEHTSSPSMGPLPVSTAAPDPQEPAESCYGEGIEVCVIDDYFARS